MRITLFITSGSKQGQRIVLRSGQIAQFGRTDWADYSFPDDARMAEIHFSVELNARGCWVRALAKDRETFVNKNRIDHVALKDRDVITAGQTTVVAMFDDGMPGQAITAVTATAVVTEQLPPRDLVAECVYLELEGAPQALAANTHDPLAFLKMLMDANELRAAVRWKTHLLSKREAVWWGCQCVRSTSPMSSKPVDVAALEAAEQWVRKPDENHRRQAESAALAGNYEGPNALLAAAVFWSDGSLSPPELPVVPPDARLTGKAVSAAIYACSITGVVLQSAVRLRQYLLLADKIQLPDG